jgi:trehalose 6-phosphate phosphatase
MRREIGVLLEHPEAAGVFLDFDGTLSHIVPVPSDARPIPGAPELLSRLGERLALVAVVSARSAGQLVEWLGPNIEIWGLHGAERAVEGDVVVADSVRPFRATMARVCAEAAADLERAGVAGASVEDKGVVATLHYRQAEDPPAVGPLVQEIATAIARRHGVAVVPGRMSFELRPPVELSKAAVVGERARAAGLRAALFAGDDTGDLPAFDALDELASEGVTGIKVAVRSDEAPPELLARADLVVEGPEGVIELLGALAES